MNDYKPSVIEPKWQQWWVEQRIFKTSDGGRKPKCYVLDMFPYPSGAGLHVGHPKGYIATDVYSRYKMANGFNVLHPMGWDAFGLPAENYAIQNKVHPKVAVDQNIARFKEQLGKIGFTYDWGREINTTDPNYYKWTQWIFLQLYKAGLAYEAEVPVNWCPKDQTVLANEDIEAGRCERCGTEVEQRNLRQWILKITQYADRLLADLDSLDWPESIKEAQRNWIGRKEGINITYSIRDSADTVTCFTTRPDTNFGATFVVLAPEHVLAKKVGEINSEVANYIKQALNKTALERIAEGTRKTGVFTGLVAINDLTGREMPIWVSDFVLGHFGTGAVVGVPGHDKHDFEFATAFSLPVLRVVVAADGDTSAITRIEQVQESEGKMINSGFLDGLAIHEATQKMMDYMEEEGWGKRVVTYNLKDWVFSRQRYWGEPIPIIHCDTCGTVPVPEKDLPVELPAVEQYQPTGTGESPLANIDSWVNVACPVCEEPARRETNTMPQWAGSSWYYLRYIDPKNNDALVGKEKESYWMPVDLYVGGAEHATRHLIYARFWHKFLFDQGFISTPEPFRQLQHVGLIRAEDGRKMSKRWGNVINPDDIVAQYGADTLRLYEMFMGPFNEAVAWSAASIVGPRRFLERVWRLAQAAGDKNDPSVQIALHHTIKRVTEDIEQFRFNTAIAAMMELVNELEKVKTVSKETLRIFSQLLAPFAPHIGEELWQQLGGEGSVTYAAWPETDEEILQAAQITIAVQVNGKLRGTLTVSRGLSQADVEVQARALENAKRHFATEPTKVIFVKNELINFVV